MTFTRVDGEILRLNLAHKKEVREVNIKAFTEYCLLSLNALRQKFPETTISIL